LTEHDRSGFIDETTPSDAEHRVFPLPVRRQVFFAYSWQVFVWSIFRHAFNSRGGFCIGSGAYFRRSTVVLIRQIIRKFAYRISNLGEALKVECPAFSISLRKLQSL